MNTNLSNKDMRFAVLAVDVVCLKIIKGKLCVLLKKTADDSPFIGMWALVGGMVRVKETVEDAAERLLANKVDIHNATVRQLHVFSGIDRDPRGRTVSVAFLSVKFENGEDENEELETKWVEVTKVGKLGYDHNEILDVARKQLRQYILDSVHDTFYIQSLAPKEFTLSELQTIYETAIAESVDKRNFRRQFLTADLLEATGEKKSDGKMRPAKLYIFKKK